MCLKLPLNPRLNSGLSLIGAVFLIVVIAAISLAITRTVQTSALGYSQEVLSLRALYAAESGSQLALNRLLPPLGTTACNVHLWDLNNYGMPNCSAEVSCRVEVVRGENFYTLQSDAQCNAGLQTAQRSVLVRVK